MKVILGFSTNFPMEVAQAIRDQVAMQMNLKEVGLTYHKETFLAEPSAEIKVVFSMFSTHKPCSRAMLDDMPYELDLLQPSIPFDPPGGKNQLPTVYTWGWTEKDLQYLRLAAQDTLIAVFKGEARGFTGDTVVNVQKKKFMRFCVRKDSRVDSVSFDIAKVITTFYIANASQQLESSNSCPPPPTE